MPGTMNGNTSCLALRSSRQALFQWLRPLNKVQTGQVVVLLVVPVDPLAEVLAVVAVDVEGIDQLATL